MDIAIRKPIAPFAFRTDQVKDIILVHNEYYPIATHVLTGKNEGESKWKILLDTEHRRNFRVNKKLIQHKTQADNLLCITADPSFILDHSSWTVDKNNSRIPLSSKIRSTLAKEMHRYAALGNSLSAIGIKNIEYNDFADSHIHNLTFIGFGIFPYDVPPEVRTTTDSLRTKGVHVKLFSADLLPTSQAIARKMGIPALRELSLTSHEMQSMHDHELAPLLEDIHIFAEINLLDFIRITRLLKAEGHHVRLHD